ncbi:hypothetical protein DFH28DRAFT_1080721 [Melampsora americana]|nr:hypothetical protein DFH28DRAFT_1080721 [Melampsora americana]
MLSSMLILILFSNSFHLLNASEYTGPYLICSGSTEMGWLARSDASNAYDFAKSKRGIRSGDSTRYKRLARCRCIQASSGDWYLNCFDGLTPDGQSTTTANSNNDRQLRLSKFQNNFPAMCFASETCPDSQNTESNLVKSTQPQLVCANGLPVGLLDQQQNLRESMAKDPLATGCSCSSTGPALTRNPDGTIQSTSGRNATTSQSSTGSGDVNPRIKLVCEQEFSDSISPYCASVGTGCGANSQVLGYMK